MHTLSREELGRRAESWASTFGIAGALVLAAAIPLSKWGWILFLCSNAGWALFAFTFRYRKLLVQTCVFTFSSALGIANTFWPGNAFQSWLTTALSWPAS